MSDTHGKVWWTELMTRDVDAAKAFYGDICGWTFMTVPMGEAGDYHLGLLGDVPVVGVMQLAPDEAAPYWLSYFAVDDLDAAVTAAEAAGGSIERPPFEIPGTGRIALLTDPTGARLGLMTPEPMDET